MSLLVSWHRRKKWRKRTKVAGDHVIVRAQAQEEEERDEPDADREERRDLHERRRLLDRVRMVPVPGGAGALRLLRNSGEVEEPHEVVRDDERARE